MFGNNTSSFGSSTFGGFGQTNNNNNNNSSGGLFGNKSAFGATNTQSNTFGSTSTFGSSSTPSGGLFGSKPASTGTGLFGSSNTGSFGFATTNSNNAFGGGSSLFGNNSASTSSGGLFGSTSTFGNTGGTSTFGASSGNTGSSIFGGGNSGTFGATQQNGTNIKYNPLTTTDTQVIKGQSQTVKVKLQVITGMKEYENKSCEELRCEDYLAGRKSGASSATPSGGGGGLFGSTTPASTTNTFGGFGNTNTANNTNNTSGGLFGNTNTTNNNTGGLFGNNSTTKPGGLFGSTTTGTTSLFGNTNNTNNTLGNNTTSAFGSGGSSLFGNNNKPATGGLFGSTATSTSSTGSSLFGNTNNSSTTGSSLFGSTNTNTGGGLFGNTATNNTSTPGSLFGNTNNNNNNKPAFGGFGSTTTTNTGFGNTGSSLFGNNTQNKTGFNLGSNTGGTTSLFGNTGTSPFGASNTGGSSLFGNTAAKPGGLFGNTNTTANTTSLFGNTTNNTTNNTLGLGGVGANTQQPVLGASLDSTHIHQVVAALSSTPFGDSPLFRNALEQHKKLKPATPPPANLGNTKSKISSKLSAVKPRPLNGGYNQLFEGLEDDIAPSPEAFLPRTSLKKLVLQSTRYTSPQTPELSRQPSDVCDQGKVSEQEPVETTAVTNNDVVDTTMNTLTSNVTPDSTNASITRANLNSSFPPIKISPIRKLPFMTLNDTHTELEENDVTQVTSPDQTLTEDDKGAARGDCKGAVAEEGEGIVACKSEKTSPNRNNDVTLQEDEADEPVLGLDGKPLKPPPPSLPFTLERPEYYTVPGAGELLGLIREETLVVKDLIVGRTGYGEVKFLGEVDLWGMDLDSTIFFRRKEITVYPDEKTKPPQGQALNRRSEVTLDCVYPVEKGTRDNVTDPKDIIKRGFPAYLEKKTFKMGAKFIEYRPETGQWTFMVKHFSQYGLLDDSSEDEEGERKEESKRVKEEEEEEEISIEGDEDLGMISDEDNTAEEICDESVAFQPRVMSKEYQGYKIGLFEESDEDCGMMEEVEDDEGEMFVQGSHFNYSSSMVLNKKGALGKTALKMEKLETNEDLKQESKRDVKELKLEEPKLGGVSVVPAVLCLPPLSKSIVNGRTHLKMDEGLTRHFAYRVGWSGSNSVIVKSDHMPGKSASHMKMFESSRGGTSSRLELSEVAVGGSTRYHSDLLEIQLHRTVFAEGAAPIPGEECLDELLEKLTENGDLTALPPSLKLMKALWGQHPEKEGEYAREQFRRERLNEWIGEQLKVLAQKETVEFSKLGGCHLRAVIAWLCAGGVVEACQLLCKSGDFQLALLVSQSSTPIVRQLVLKQLEEWRDSGHDALVSHDRLRVYVFLAGEQVWESSTRRVEVCEGLDWLSSFSIFLRSQPPSLPLDVAVKEFQDAFEAGGVTAPVVDKAGNLSIFWQLILLYCNPAHPLPEVLNNQGVGPDMLDERGVWFIWTTLTSLGLPRSSPSLCSKLCTSYSAQLDRAGLWDWAVFVAQHLPTPAARDVTIRGIVQRNIAHNTTDTDTVCEGERMCVARHHVQEQVFHCARAVRARYARHWENVVTWYTAAGMYDTAHQTLMQFLAPHKIVSREEAVLVPLLSPLHAHRGEIANWTSGGGVYHAYLSLPSQLPESEEELECLRTSISNTGYLLNNLPYNTLPEIAAVNMMGLRTCTLLLEVWKVLFGDTENRELLLTMKTFPLPSDYYISDVITKLSAEIVAQDNFDSVA